MKHNDQSKEIEIFLSNIAWLRQHHKLSKKKMASLLHISVPTLEKLERGELPPYVRANIFFHIEDHFHLTPEEQLTRRLDE